MKSSLTTICLVLGLASASAYPLDSVQRTPRAQGAFAVRTLPAPERNDPWGVLDPSRLKLQSHAYLVVDDEGHRIAGKAADAVQPIASVTKLMTAMVVLDTDPDLDAMISLRADDRDHLRHTGSRLRVENARLSRRDLLLIALMSSENRAAAALGRTTLPGGTAQFVRAMNRKAQDLGMTRSHFADPTGLDAGNTASAEDLVRLVEAAMDYPLIRYATTYRSAEVHPYPNGRSLTYRNTNRLLHEGIWDIQLSKTGFINEAGHCLVMRATIADRPLYIVLLNSYGKLTPFGDANRVRDWIESSMVGGGTQRG